MRIFTMLFVTVCCRPLRGGVDWNIVPSAFTAVNSSRPPVWGVDCRHFQQRGKCQKRCGTENKFQKAVQIYCRGAYRLRVVDYLQELWCIEHWRQCASRLLSVRSLKAWVFHGHISHGLRSALLKSWGQDLRVSEFVSANAAAVFGYLSFGNLFKNTIIHGNEIRAAIKYASGCAISMPFIP